MNDDKSVLEVTHTHSLPEDAGKWDTGSSGFSLQIQLASSGRLKKDPSVMERSWNSAASLSHNQRLFKVTKAESEQAAAQQSEL